MSKSDLSVIVPFYNENKNLGQLHQELIEALNKLDIKNEIIYVNDGSSDDSIKTLNQAISDTKSLNDVNISLISFRRNFGQTAATSAGIDYARGNLVAFLDADLQNDPKDLVKFYGEIQQGYDAVFGWRKEREDFFLRNFASKIANFIIRKIFQIPLHDVGCSLKIVKKEILDDIHLYGESHRIMPVLIYWKGVKIKELVTNHRKRLFEKSKYGYSRILKLVIDLITLKFLNSYGTKPAYVFGAAGILSNVLGFITLVWVGYQKIFLQIYVHRNPLFLISIFFVLLGVQFVLMGLLAELLVRTYFESQKKTTYEIKEVKTF